MTDAKARKVVPLKPRPETLSEAIKTLAAVSDNVSWSEHCLDRMDERSITIPDALRVLCSGHIEGEITAGNRAGEWKCKVVARVKGSREIGVVTIVVMDRRLFVKTVEWEDL